jgi:hypothetical protein
LSERQDWCWKIGWNKPSHFVSHRCFIDKSAVRILFKIPGYITPAALIHWR